MHVIDAKKQNGDDNSWVLSSTGQDIALLAFYQMGNTSFSLFNSKVGTSFCCTSRLKE
jgi:hypothetical protein